MLDETYWMTRTNNINFHPTFLQHLSKTSSSKLDKMFDRLHKSLITSILMFWCNPLCICYKDLKDPHGGKAPSNKTPALTKSMNMGIGASNHSFRIVSGDSPETMRKLCLFAKFSYQQIRWTYGIFLSVYISKLTFSYNFIYLYHCNFSVLNFGNGYEGQSSRISSLKRLRDLKGKAKFKNTVKILDLWYL